MSEYIAKLPSQIPRAQGDLLKLLSSSNQESKTQRYSICSDIKAAHILEIEEAGTRECLFKPFIKYKYQLIDYLSLDWLVIYALDCT